MEYKKFDLKIIYSNLMIKTDKLVGNGTPPRIPIQMSIRSNV